MLALFRTNQIAYSILLLLYAVILRFPYFTFPYPSDQANDGVLSLFLRDSLASNYLLSGIITLVVVFIQAVLINNLANKYRLFSEMTLFPGLFYILLVSSVQDFLPMSAILLGNTFLILALENLLKIYKNTKCADAIFNIGFWIGTAALFYNAYLIFFFLAFVGLSVLRSFKFKELIMVLCGYILPFLFASAYFFWHDQFQTYWNVHILQQFSFLDFRLTQDWSTYSKLILLAIFFLIGLMNGYNFDKSSKTRNYMLIIYAALLISGFTFLIQDNVRISHFLIIMAPLSILVTARFLSLSKTTAEIVHLVFFLAVIFMQIRPFMA